MASSLRNAARGAGGGRRAGGADDGLRAEPGMASPAGSWTPARGRPTSRGRSASRRGPMEVFEDVGVVERGPRPGPEDSRGRRVLRRPSGGAHHVRPRGAGDAPPLPADPANKGETERILIDRLGAHGDGGRAADELDGARAQDESGVTATLTRRRREHVGGPHALAGRLRRGAERGPQDPGARLRRGRLRGVIPPGRRPAGLGPAGRRDDDHS